MTILRIQSGGTMIVSNGGILNAAAGAAIPELRGDCQIPTAYRDAILALSPDGYWQLNEPAEDTTALDTSTNSIDGTYTDTNVMWEQLGPYVSPVNPSVSAISPDDDCAVRLGAGGTNGDWITISGTSLLDFIGDPDQEYSFGLWFKSVGGTPTGDALMSKTEFTPSNWNDLSIVGSGALVFQLFDGTNNPAASSAANAYNDGSWHHIVAMRTLTTGVHGTNSIRLYVDGSLEDSASASNSWDTSNTNPLQLGQRGPSGGFGADGTNGTMAHCFVTDFALSDSQVSDLWNQDPT